MMNCEEKSQSQRSLKATEEDKSIENLMYLLSDLARLLSLGRCLSSSARALGFLHCGGTT